MILTLPGSPAFSRFRIEKLQARLFGVLRRQVSVYGEYVHFADVEPPLLPEERAVLDRLLQYGPAIDSQTVAGRLILVLPRPGTISPWSSKATDIAANCGLHKIRRLERGLAYQLAVQGDPLNERELLVAADTLHD